MSVDIGALKEKLANIANPQWFGWQATQGRVAFLCEEVATQDVPLLIADLEAARVEIRELRMVCDSDEFDVFERLLKESRATEAELRARIVRHHDTTIMAKLQSGVRCPACSAIDAQEPRT